MTALTDRVPGGVDHPAWRTGVATALGYGVVLLVLTTVLFLVPYVLYSALG